mmetsp:Transcript_13083/g.37309  ORF Transcript_13083/g.37309 Transcript_13083/m.37309 type:complete len:356 (-) Transcript_13083:1633-2700(-)
MPGGALRLPAPSLPPCRRAAGSGRRPDPPPPASRHGHGRRRARVAAAQPRRRRRGLRARVLRTGLRQGRAQRLAAAPQDGPAGLEVQRRLAPARQGAGHEELGQGVLEEPLHGAAERPRPVGRVGATRQDRILQRLRPAHAEALAAASRHGLRLRGLRAARRIAQHQPGYFAEFWWAQCTEHEHFINTIEKLGPEALLQLHLHGRPHCGIATACAGLLQHLPAAHIGGHDHDTVREARGAALAVRQAPVLQDLQEQVEDLGVRLLDLVQDHDTVGPPPHGPGELAAARVVEAHVSRRRADQPGDAVRLGVLAHIQADQRLWVGVVLGCQDPAQLCLADTGGPRKVKGSDRASCSS